LELPPQPPEDVVADGGDGIGTEDPRPDDASMSEKVAGHAQYGMGRAFQKLGNALNWGGLARMGERWMESALESVPRISEKIFGDQEAALRDLLRRFRDGDIEGALKRALPMGESGSQRGRPAENAILPTHNLGYSLGNILNWGSRSGASIWFGGLDVQQELYREYRKAAESAVARGDWKRAAFIYGKLLADWREAAAVLARGGLNHDAAILYRDKLGDPLKAAHCFEAAGEFDEALAIYDRLRDHERAGDLLRRLGEEDAAVERYLQAADLMIERGKGHLAGGEFIQRKTGRVDLAETYFAAGWSLRYRSLELGNAVPCAVHLATIYSEQAQEESFFTLLQEGEDFFAPPGNAPAAGQFFNTMARLAEREPWQERKDELRDRCLLGLASKLREQPESERAKSNLVSTLFAGTGNWEPPVVNDVTFAVRRSPLRLKNPSTERPATFLSLGTGTVTAVGQALNSGEIFVGFENGRLVSFHPASSRVTSIAEWNQPVTAIAVDNKGEFLIAARHEVEHHHLTSFRLSDNTFLHMADRYLEGYDELRLAPWIMPTDDGSYLAIARKSAPDQPPLAIHGVDLLLRHETKTDCTDPQCLDLLLPRPLWSPHPLWLVLESHRLHRVESRPNTELFGRSAGQIPINWRPEAHPENSVTAPPVSSYRVNGVEVELTGLGEVAGIYWLRLDVGQDILECRRLLATNCENGYRCVTLIRPGVLAGITSQNRVIWLRAEGDRLKEFAPSQRIPSTSLAVACFSSPTTEELLIILQNGSLLRMPTAK
jgi:tetratricopeptide (TPR) repeat protein